MPRKSSKPHHQNSTLNKDIPELLQQILNDCKELANIADKEELQSRSRTAQRIKDDVAKYRTFIIAKPTSGEQNIDYQNIIDEANRALQASMTEASHAHHDSSRF